MFGRAAAWPIAPSMVGMTEGDGRAKENEKRPAKGEVGLHKKVASHKKVALASSQQLGEGDLQERRWTDRAPDD